jgi:hypothetical protein
MTKYDKIRMTVKIVLIARKKEKEERGFELFFCLLCLKDYRLCRYLPSSEANPKPPSPPELQLKLSCHFSSFLVLFPLRIG